MAKQTTITIETKSCLVLRCRISSHSWCPECRAEADFITLNPPGNFNPGAASLEEWLKAEDVHQAKALDGSWLICLGSLLNHVQNTKPNDCGKLQLPQSEKERT